MTSMKCIINILYLIIILNLFQILSTVSFDSWAFIYGNNDMIFKVLYNIHIILYLIFL